MKKHILIVSQYFYPEQFRINDIALELVKRGYRVTVLTGIPNYPEGKFYDGYSWTKKRKEQWNGIDIIRIPLISRGNSSVRLIFNYFSFVVSGLFWSKVTQVEADVVFTFEVSPMTQALIGVWYAKKRNISHYLYVQDLWPENVEAVTGIHAPIIITPISRMVNYIYKNCDKIFATSPSFVKEIRKRVLDNKEKITYLPQFAEDFYKPSSEKSELIPQDGMFNITFTGNIGTAQGLEILPRCAQLLKENGIQVRFNIVGNGRNKDNLIKKIAENQTEEYFHFIGKMPATDIPNILAASDVAFLSFSDDPLYSMTIPAKLQSYMACGMPILASASGETKRIIEDAECGICCEIGNERALVEAIEKMMCTNLDVMALNSVRYFEDNFQKEKIMKDLDKSF